MTSTTRLETEMDARTSLVDQLESIVSGKDISKRATILRKITDLFIVGSESFSTEHLDLFDDVMSKLLDQVEQEARVQFGNRLAKLSNAPANAMRQLAFDDAIEVAAPVLQHSDRIDNETLIEIATSKSQQHLLAISGRKVLAAEVTDVLLERGDDGVVAGTARNGGAQFSDLGISCLVSKAGANATLALDVWSRADIPRCHLVKLFAEASEAVQRQMAQSDPHRAELIKAAVTKATDQIQATTRERSGDWAAVMSHIEGLHAAGELNEAQLHAFAGEGSFEKVTASLALLCQLPIGVVERALVQKQTDQILVMAKAVDLSWVTTVSLLLLQAGVTGSSRQQLDQCFASFLKLQKRTAQTALQFYRMRDKASRAVN